MDQLIAQAHGQEGEQTAGPMAVENAEADSGA